MRHCLVLMFFTVLNSTLIVNIKNGTGILQKGNPNDYYVAYWDRNHWCRATKEIYCTTDPIMPEKVMYHIDSLPSQAIYILFDKAYRAYIPPAYFPSLGG